MASVWRWTPASSSTTTAPIRSSWRCWRELGVATQAQQHELFSVRNDSKGLEYNGTTINTLFAQRRNILRPSFLAMVRDILRFNRAGATAAVAGAAASCRWAAACASTTTAAVRRQLHHAHGRGDLVDDADGCCSFPARFFVRFLCNHGMLSVNDRPQWRTIEGGSARYVERLTAPFRDRIRLRTPVESMRRQPGSGHGASRAAAKPQRYRRGVHGLPQRPGAGLLADADAGGARGAGGHSLPAQRGDAAHRHAPDAASPAGLGMLELPQLPKQATARWR